ncbi:MAG TPA: NUDIX hydrolase [Candidatus Hydrogenedentes bacterium]|jgi:ADP-ribose pyrophosphatase|nr:MAG: ADP-ribose pyrophosphatase [Candidatus Hydrogenedentes bacterium ADurb.Bin170]HNZ48092.1 NUDIX hydrolase [Candidatus Hydrogenedentota bacterium]HOD95982.1 NUDIX hydrolase [Candidatus Hydrogenedentota bacterium]HPK25369.1 NUDIX hydrolase [Candidatus Hydrogenedentota bacterium]HPX86888.1 NUDIX hydrolase [Candidatus Hydrogenedentota bacterium]
MEIWKNSELVFVGKVVALRTGEVRLDDGSEAYREVVEHPGGVCILPFTGQAFVLVKQFRIALGKDMIEAPAGKLEVNETPLQCAVKEMHEETGYRADRLISLGVIHPSVGFCSEAIHLFLALDLTEIGQKLEKDERIEMLHVPLEEASALACSESLQDAKTVVILNRALAWLSARKKEI